MRGLAADVEVNYNTVSKVYMSLEQDGYIQSKRRQGAFVCDVSDKPGVNIASTAEIVTVEYLKRCFELGMSLEDVEAQFYASLQDAKAKRDKGEEAKDDEANEHTAERAPARIVVFSGCAEDTEQRPAGNPVSYTHLDVYKRQTLAWRCCCFPFWGWTRPDGSRPTTS